MEVAPPQVHTTHKREGNKGKTPPIEPTIVTFSLCLAPRLPINDNPDETKTPYQALLEYYNQEEPMCEIVEKTKERNFHGAKWRTLINYNKDTYKEIFMAVSGDIQDLLEEAL